MITFWFPPNLVFFHHPLQLFTRKKIRRSENQKCSSSRTLWNGRVNVIYNSNTAYSLVQKHL